MIGRKHRNDEQICMRLAAEATHMARQSLGMMQYVHNTLCNLHIDLMGEPPLEPDARQRPVLGDCEPLHSGAG